MGAALSMPFFLMSLYLHSLKSYRPMHGYLEKQIITYGSRMPIDPN